MCDCKFDLLKESKRLGRAHYVCPKCGDDVTILLVFLVEAMNREKEIKKEKADARIRARSNVASPRRAKRSTGDRKKAEK